MLFKTRSASACGIQAYLIDVEVNISAGTNRDCLIVGLPDTAVRESRNRIIATIRNNARQVKESLSRVGWNLSRT